MQTARLAALMFLCSAISVLAAQVPYDPGEPGVITGKVIDFAGQPVPDARVYVREHNMPQTGAVRYVATDQSGQFRIANLRPGDYDVHAVPNHSASMLGRSMQRVHLPKDKPMGNVTLQIGSPGSQKG